MGISTRSCNYIFLILLNGKLSGRLNGKSSARSVRSVPVKLARNEPRGCPEAYAAVREE